MARTTRRGGALYTELSQEQDVRHTAILTVPLIVVRKKKAPFGAVELPAVFGLPMKFNRGSRNSPRRNPLFKQSKLYDTPEQHARLRLRPFFNESCSYPVKLSAELTNGTGTMPGHPIGFECAFFSFHKHSGHSGTRCMAFTRALG